MHANSWTTLGNHINDAVLHQTNKDLGVLQCQFLVVKLICLSSTFGFTTLQCIAQFLISTPACKAYVFRVLLQVRHDLHDLYEFHERFTKCCRHKPMYSMQTVQLFGQEVSS